MRKIAQMSIEELYQAYREAPVSDCQRIGKVWLVRASMKRDAGESYEIELAAARQWLVSVAEEMRAAR